MAYFASNLDTQPKKNTKYAIFHTSWAVMANPLKNHCALEHRQLDGYVCNTSALVALVTLKERKNIFGAKKRVLL